MKLFAQVLIILLILLTAFLVVGCFIKKKWLSSQSKFWQVIGSFCSHPAWLFISIFMLAVTILSWRPDLIPAFNDKTGLCELWLWLISHTKRLLLITLILTLFLLIQSSWTLSAIFTLRKEDIWITRSQIFLLTVVLLLVFVVYVFSALFLYGKFGDAAKSIIPGTCICGVIGWIFQDSIKGAATFVKLRLKGLLNIGDWIKLDKSGVDGKIRNISLTTITIENWDSTTSSIPMSILYSEQLQNLQKMNDGRTNGRRMTKEFIVDSSWIHLLNNEDVLKLKSILGENDPFFLEQVREGKQNIQVYREYLYYYLHCHPRISHEPGLVVRWMEHIKEGVVLQVYAFLLDTSLMGFEKTQSAIFEHAIESMDWFGLQLYQSPSSYDSKNRTIYLANNDETE